MLIIICTSRPSSTEQVARLDCTTLTLRQVERYSRRTVVIVMYVGVLIIVMECGVGTTMYCAGPAQLSTQC